MFAVISKFTVINNNNMTESVKYAFIARPHLVDLAPGFVRLDVLSPLENPDEIWLLTYWEDRASFEVWRAGHYKEVHAMIPAGVKLAQGGTELTFFEHVTS